LAPTARIGELRVVSTGQDWTDDPCPALAPLGACGSVPFRDGACVRRAPDYHV